VPGNYSSHLFNIAANAITETSVVPFAAVANTTGGRPAHLCCPRLAPIGHLLLRVLLIAAAPVVLVVQDPRSLVLAGTRRHLALPPLAVEPIRSLQLLQPSCEPLMHPRVHVPCVQPSCEPLMHPLVHVLPVTSRRAAPMSAAHAICYVLSLQHDRLQAGHLDVLQANHDTPRAALVPAALAHGLGVPPNRSWRCRMTEPRNAT
jgi:hypothetical protein